MPASVAALPGRRSRHGGASHADSPVHWSAFLSKICEGMFRDPLVFVMCLAGLIGEEPHDWLRRAWLYRI